MKNKTKFLIFLLFIALSIILAFFSGSLGLDKDTIKEFILVNPSFASLIYTLLFVTLTIFSFSVSVMTLIGAFFFSGPQTITYALIGLTCSSVVHFFIARKLGQDYVRQVIKKRGGKLERFGGILEKNTFKTIIILSAIFFVPPIVRNLLGGLMKINLKKYLCAIILGNLPNAIFTVYLLRGIVYSNISIIVISIIGLILTTLLALHFYTGEIKEILKISFPWAFKKK